MEDLDQMFDAARPAVEAAAAPRPGDAEVTSRIVGESLKRWEVGAAVATATAAGTATMVAKSGSGLGVVAKIVLAGVLVAGAGVVVVSLTSDGPEETATTEEPKEAAMEAPDRPKASPPAPHTPTPAVPEPSIDPEPEPVPDGEAAPAPEEPTGKTLSARKMLERADKSRSAGDHAAAVRQYRAILRDHPTSREASVSRVSAAELLLKKLHKPASARRLYRAYLRRSPDGNLAEEALWGSARASRKLGDADAERTALEKLVDDFPSSVRAGPSKTRLETLKANE